MGKARKPVKIFRKNRANKIKTTKRIEKNNELLKKIKKEMQ
jgi:hypothetical protein